MNANKRKIDTNVPLGAEVQFAKIRVIRSFPWRSKIIPIIGSRTAEFQHGIGVEIRLVCGAGRTPRPTEYSNAKSLR